MHFNPLITALMLPAAGMVSMVNAAQGTANFVATWQEAGLQRYRFTFSGVSTDNYGQDFLNAIRNYGGISSNWQCWYDPATGWTFDDSEWIGCGGAATINNAINSVTGQNDVQTGFINAFSQFGCSSA